MPYQTLQPERLFKYSMSFCFGKQATMPSYVHTLPVGICLAALHSRKGEKTL